MYHFVQTIQLLQMVAGIVVTGLWTYLHYTSNAATGIRVPEHATILICASAGMYASYFLLFALFYVQRYCSKPRGAAGDKKRAPNSNGAGNFSSASVRWHACNC